MLVVEGLRKEMVKNWEENSVREVPRLVFVLKKHQMETVV